MMLEQINNQLPPPAVGRRPLAVVFWLFSTEGDFHLSVDPSAFKTSPSFLFEKSSRQRKVTPSLFSQNNVAQSLFVSFNHVFSFALQLGLQSRRSDVVSSVFCPPKNFSPRFIPFPTSWRRDGVDVFHFSLTLKDLQTEGEKEEERRDRKMERTTAGNNREIKISLILELWCWLRNEGWMREVLFCITDGVFPASPPIRAPAECLLIGRDVKGISTAGDTSVNY